MEDGTAAGRAANHLPAARLEARYVDIGKRLRMPQRKACGLPGIEPEGRAGYRAGHVFEDRFVGGHIPGAVSRWSDQESPVIGHAQIITVRCRRPAMAAIAYPRGCWSAVSRRADR